MTCFAIECSFILSHQIFQTGVFRNLHLYNFILFYFIIIFFFCYFSSIYIAKCYDVRLECNPYIVRGHESSISQLKKKVLFYSFFFISPVYYDTSMIISKSFSLSCFYLNYVQCPLYVEYLIFVTGILKYLRPQMRGIIIKKIKKTRLSYDYNYNPRPRLSSVLVFKLAEDKWYFDIYHEND